LLRNNPVTTVMRDSYRFVICLYIDLILIDEEFRGSMEDDDMSANINDNIKITLKKIAVPIYKNYLKKSK
jgi:hypothetical protein